MSASRERRRTKIELALELELKAQVDTLIVGVADAEGHLKRRRVEDYNLSNKHKIHIRLFTLFTSTIKLSFVIF